MKIIYLAAGHAVIEKYNNLITYNDLYVKRDLISDMYINFSNLPQKFDNIKNISTKNRQGGYNVNVVIEFFLDVVMLQKLFIRNEKEC